MLCYVRLSPTQWLPRLGTADFCYCGAPAESSEVAARSRCAKATQGGCASVPLGPVQYGQIGLPSIVV